MRRDFVARKLHPYYLLAAIPAVSLWPSVGETQGKLFVVPQANVFDATGTLEAGAKVFFYADGTSTKQNVYTTAALSIAHSNPVVADAYGKLPAIFLDPALGEYKIVVAPSGDSDPPVSPIETVDDYPTAGTLYPSTIQENEARVTPTAYQYPPGHITRYWSGSGSIHRAWESSNLQAAAGGAPIYVPRTAHDDCYESTRPLTVDHNADVYFEPGACIAYTGADPDPTDAEDDVVALTIGAAEELVVSRRYENLHFKRLPKSDWKHQGEIGIRVYNASGSHFSFQEISDFTVCFQAMASGGRGFQGNTLEFNHVFDCKIARDWTNETNGFTNDNLVIGGRIIVRTGVNDSQARYGDRITSSDDSYLTNNNNVFLKPLLELNAADASGEAVSVVVTHGEDNHWIDARSEGNDLTMRTANASTRNLFEAGFLSDATEVAEQLDASSENLVVSQRNRVAKYFTYPVFQLKDAGRKAIGRSDTSIVIPEVVWFTSSSATRTAASSTGVTYDGDFVTIPSTRGLGVGVVTTDADAKELIVRRAGTAGGRVHVIAYNGSNTILTAAGTVVGRPSHTLTYHGNSFGGSWSTGADTLGDVYLRVSASTAYVFIIIAGGSSPAVISDFEVLSATARGARVVSGGYTTPSALTPSYAGSNCLADRTFDADSAAVAEIADVLCTLINDLKISRVID